MGWRENQRFLGKLKNDGKAGGIVVGAFLKKYRELILYVFFGGLTTLVDWASYWLLTDLLHVPYMAANLLSQILSILFAYVTNRIWVFESKVHGAKGIFAEMVKFFGARGVSLLLNMLCMFVGVDLLSGNDKVVKLIASVLVVIANYVFSKLFVFRSRKKENSNK